MKIYLCGAAIMLASLASAGPTSLVYMPIADVLDSRSLAYDLTATGFERRIDKGYAWSHGLEFGVTGRMELGVDNDMLGHYYFNAKFQVIQKKTLGIDALSVGIWNDADTHGQLYAVARKDFKQFRLHFGAIQGTGGHALIGADAPFYNGTVTAEWMSGQQARGWVSYGHALPFLPNLTLIVGAGIPGRPSDGVQHMVEALYTVRIP